MMRRGQLWLSPLPAGLTDISARAQLAEPWLSYSISDDPVASVKSVLSPWVGKVEHLWLIYPGGTDTDKQDPSLRKFVEDG